MNYTAMLSRHNLGNYSKYIVMQNETTAVLFGGPFPHQTLKETFDSSFGDGFMVQGGGLYTINDHSKRICITGKSGSYGKADSELVQKILQKEYSEYKIRIDVNDLVL